jgi:hypothetical protein
MKRHRGKPRKGKITKNLSLPSPLTKFTEVYCRQNGRTVSGLVEDLLRRFYESKGINVDAPIEKVVTMIRRKKKKKSTKQRGDLRRTKRFITNDAANV